MAEERAVTKMSTTSISSSYSKKNLVQSSSVTNCSAALCSSLKSSRNVLTSLGGFLSILIIQCLVVYSTAMHRRYHCGLSWLEFDLFQGILGLIHGFFLRHGGVSSGPYESLNCSGSVGDVDGNVYVNQGRVLEALRMQPQTPIAYVRQVHGSDIVAVEGALPVVIPAGDAMTTGARGMALMTTSADCQIALFYDTLRHVIANVHCGWRGSVANIYATVVRHLKEKYGCRPADLLVGICPSLGPSHAEFVSYREELPKSFWSCQSSPCHFDFWAISRCQLEEAGLLPHHIEIAAICSYENAIDCFSYRREKVTGRHGAFISHQ